MPRYRATSRGYLNQLGLQEPGDEFDYEGKPSEKWMTPINDAAREEFKKAGFNVADPPASAASAPGAGEKGSKGKKGAPAAPGAGEKGSKGKAQESTGDQEVI